MKLCNEIVHWEWQFHGSFISQKSWPSASTLVSTNTFCHLYSQCISSWFRTFSFTTYNFVSKCLAAHLTHCHRSKLLKWLSLLSSYQPLSTPGTSSLDHFACPSASYHAIPYLCITMIIIALFLEFFHTKPPSVNVSDNCGFRYTFHKFYFCTHNLLSTWSFQLSMRPTF